MLAMTNYLGQADEPASNIIMTIYGTDHASLSVVTNIRQCCTSSLLAVTDGATTVIITRRSIFAIATTTPVFNQSQSEQQLSRVAAIQ